MLLVIHWLSTGGKLGFYDISSTQIAAWNSLKFISKANDVYEMNYLFRINIIEEIRD